MVYYGEFIVYSGERDDLLWRIPIMSSKLTNNNGLQRRFDN